MSVSDNMNRWRSATYFSKQKKCRKGWRLGLSGGLHTRVSPRRVSHGVHNAFGKGWGGGEKGDDMQQRALGWTQTQAGAVGHSLSK